MHRTSIQIRGGEGDYKWQIKRKGQPEEVAQLCAWLLCDASQYITGTIQVSSFVISVNLSHLLTLSGHRWRLHVLKR